MEIVIPEINYWDSSIVGQLNNQSLLAVTYLPQRLAAPVLSALKRFTSVFGMGTGGTTSLQPPESPGQINY
jgi:hypothetical protein